MTNQIYPCLWFNTEAEEAANFYTSLFKNSGIKNITRYGKEGFETHKMPEGTVMVADFELGEKRFFALNGGPAFKFNPSVSLFVECTSIDETNELWDKLAEDGTVLMAIDKYPWSERYGWVADKFGLSWQISLSGAAITCLKITPAFLFANQQFGNAEKAIDFYTSLFDHSAKELIMHYPEGDTHAGKVLFSRFTLNHYPMIAMDGPGVHDFCFNEAVSFVVDCNTQQEINFYWNRFTADGGEESQCGWLKDKFGVSWQIVPALLAKLLSEPGKSQHAMKAVMQMKKIEINKLTEA